MPIPGLNDMKERLLSVCYRIAILREIKFFENYYKISKGQRTDLNPVLKKIKEERDNQLKSVPKSTQENLKRIDSMAAKLYRDGSKAYLNVFKSMDNHKTTLNGQYQHLLSLIETKNNQKIIPETYSVNSKNIKIYNKSSADMSEVKSGTVNAIITSPPYYGMVDYGTGKNQIGMESSIDTYLNNLIVIFIECYRILRDDGSLFVNINDCVIGGKYQAVPQKFVLRMLEQKWILNDELLWIKNNPTYSHGKRSVRSHEHIFHFVKSADFVYNDGWLTGLTDPNNSISYGTGKENAKLLSGLDFRDSVLSRNASNTLRLREACLKEKGFFLTQIPTFPIDLPLICGLLSTKEHDLIVDCFAGTSTTGEFAQKFNRQFRGYEIKPEFVLASAVRLGIKIPPLEIIRLQAQKKEMIAPKVQGQKPPATMPKRIHAPKMKRIAPKVRGQKTPFEIIRVQSQKKKMKV